MASIRSNNYRRRSRSASHTSPIVRRSPDNSLRIATKRVYPAQPFRSVSQGPTSQKWDVDSWSRGKRRRPDISSPDVSMDCIQDKGQHDIPDLVVPSRFTFSTSPADFNMFSKSDRSSRRRASYSSPRLDSRLPNTLDHTELTRLRSSAFWELHRSVAENGEGFVQRMRDYEHVRSLQVSDPTCRGRKRVFDSQDTRNASYLLDSDVSDDDDDIQIFAGEVSSSPCSRHPHHSIRTFSLDVPDLRQSEGGYSESPRHTHPIIPSRPPSLAYSPGAGGFSIPGTSDPPSSPSMFLSSSPNTPPSLSSPIQPHPSVSFDEQPLPMPSEKALSDLSLALANGAGSINDYACLENPTNSQQIDAGESGDLWH